MRKLLVFLVLLFFLGIYVVCSSDFWFDKVADLKMTNTYLKSQRNNYGDLFGISFLSKYKIEIPKYEVKTLPRKNNSVHLYLMGDSYLAKKVHANNFKNVDSVYFTDWRNDDSYYHLDTTKTNILIIETVERYFLDRFKDTSTIKFAFKDELQQQAPEKPFDYSFFKKGINDNLEYMLFDNYFFTFVKQIRADIAYACFDKKSPNISISDDKKYLFFSGTTDTIASTSSFKHLKTSDLKNRIAGAERYVSHYKSKGFDEVYISIIPNPATILGYKNLKYNNLIPLIEKNKTFETINMYPIFRSSKQQLYLFSDTHWNSKGLQLWVDEVNKILEKK